MRFSFFSAIVAALLVGACAGFAAGTEPRPNIVIFIADDAGWGDYGANGSKLARTPNIDRIAREGAVLDRFFVQPVCSPTRAELLTGRYHPRMGVTGTSVGAERMDLREKTLGDAFKAAGYATGVFGKWHNGSQWPYHPMARGFGEFFGYSTGHMGELFDAPLEDNGRMVRTKGYIVDVCTDRALDFIDRHRGGPFLCYVPFTSPHAPWTVPDADWHRFRELPITQTATDANRENADHTRCVHAMMANQDRNVGRVLDKLDDLGLTRNTLVIYLSDNGPNSARWNGGMKGLKGSTDEGGVRSPGFFRWPARLKAGHVVAEPAAVIDLLPTLTALAGIQRVGDLPLDGRDLSPLLLGRPQAWSDRMLFQTWRGAISVRTAGHRMDKDGRLFDLRADPGQTMPIESREPALATELRAAVARWRAEMFGPAGQPGGPGEMSSSAVDPRPFPVGYREFPVTRLTARDGSPTGQVKRSASSPNSSFFTNWTTLGDRLTWNVQVATAGRYAVMLDYTCPAGDVGAEIELSFMGRRLTGKVGPAWDPPFYTNQDTLPRPDYESPLKEFRALELGEVELPAGTGPLVLRALSIPGRTVLDLRRVTLTLRP